jgi:hypothetical protein
VTGIAAEAAPVDLKLMRTDTTQASVRNVYEVRKGVEVTLIETTLPQQAFDASTAAKRKLSAPQPMAAAAVPPPAAKVIAAAINTITWVKGGKGYTLIGALSTVELEKLRQRLPEDKR